MCKMENYPTTNKNNIQAYINGTGTYMYCGIKQKKADFNMVGIPGLPSL